MSVFADYAQYYNLLYADKKYTAEVDFVLSQMNFFGATPKSLLDLGCGTGRHAAAFSDRGVAVTGVDLSPEMIAIAWKTVACSAFRGPLPRFVQGNASTVRLGEHFDCVVSLFHVMSYQTTEKMALDVLQTARAHLRPGGLFLFDFWYGPGVLADPPERREKKWEDDSTAILRMAEPVHDVANNTVEIRYSITVTDKTAGEKRTFPERHFLRYWFLSELRYLAQQAGFVVCAEGEWLMQDFSFPTPWYAWVLLRLEAGTVQRHS